MLKHSFQSNTLRSRDGGDSEDSTSSSDEEQAVREKMELKKRSMGTPYGNRIFTNKL